MTYKKNPADEVFMDGKRRVRFTADFGFAQALESIGKDVYSISIDLMNSHVKSSDIFDVLVCSIKDIDDEPVKDKPEYAKYMIEKYGLAECAIVARYL